MNQRFEPAVPVERLRPHPANPRQGDVGAIYQSMVANGFFGAVLVQEGTGIILAGTHRWRAAQEAGRTTVPVLWADVDDEAGLRIMLADNRTADQASYDNPTLADVLRSLSGTEMQLEGTGWTIEEYEQIMSDLSTPVRVEPNASAPVSAKRPVYELIFDGDESLQTFRGLLAQLKEAYPQYDSVETRLVAVLENSLS